MRTRLRLALCLGLAAIFMHLVLVLPDRPDGFRLHVFATLALELPVMLLGALALGRRAQWPAAFVACALMVLTALRIADIAALEVFGRRFDPVVDMNLVSAAMRLVAGGFGIAAAVALTVAIVVALMLFGWLVYHAIGRWARAGAALSRSARIGAGSLALAFAVLPVAETATALNDWDGWDPPGSSRASRLAIKEVLSFRRSRAALTEFKAAAAHDPWQDRTGALAQLHGRDVVIIFIESYGRAAFDNPGYEARHRATLTAGMAKLERAGLDMRSGWLASPVQGGQSWLAHATIASGLEIEDQRRYGALLSSPRLTLYDIAARAGYDTLAVAPAIVLPWPEGPQFGFGHILEAADLGYAGPPFNWVTMPDQYTLAAFERLAPRGKPLMTEIALISSHAPWTPVAELVPWDMVADGRIFADMAGAGPTPREVWSNRETIRRHYGLSLDYAIQTVLDWAALPRMQQPLVIVLGDHQAAATISQNGGMDVPMHLIGPPETITLFDNWGWTKGLEPDADLPTWPMNRFRDRFLDATSVPEGQL